MQPFRFSPRWLYTVLFSCSLAISSFGSTLRPQPQSTPTAKDTAPAHADPAPRVAAVGMLAGKAPAPAPKPAGEPARSADKPVMASEAGVVELRPLDGEGEEVGPETNLPPGTGNAELIGPEEEAYLDPDNLDGMVPAELPAPPKPKTAPRKPRTVDASSGGNNAPQIDAGSIDGNIIWPVGGQLTSRYGPRGGRWHRGIDIAGPAGREIRAAKSGTVVLAGWYGGYGKAVIIDHGGGFSTLYGHTSKILVSEGERVEKGQVIALVGSTGRSTGPHLHFETRVNGNPVNPFRFLP